MIGGFFRPGDSPVHRLPAGAKLVALLVFGGVLLSVSSPILAGAGLLSVLVSFRLAGFPLSLALAQIRPLALVLLLLFAAQIWLATLEDAFLLVLRFAALILAASLVTLTTRTADLVEALERALSPFERFGVDTAKISLAISLAIRFLPAIGQIVEEVREAQAARGRSRSIVALAVPVIVRLLKMADEVSDAIDARS